MIDRQRWAHVRALAFGAVLSAVFLACLWAFLPRQQPGTAAPPHPRPLFEASPRDPVELVVPRIDLRSRVVPIGMDDEGVLHPPEDVRQTGWWLDSARPGASHGQTLLTGHTVHSGGGVMNRLDELRPGDRLRVRTATSVTTYRILQVSTWSRQQVAENAEELFGQDRNHRRLVLVTCTDWVDGEYRSNVIAFAAPLAHRPIGPR